MGVKLGLFTSREGCDSVREQGADKDIWTEDGRSNGKMEKAAY